MSDPKPTVYEADPHTRAKHQILGAYLKRWTVILDRSAQKIGRTHQRLLYFDGFAGAGEYSGSVPGSPQVPIDVVETHVHDFTCPIEIRLVEKRPDRAQYLARVIKEKKAKLVRSSQLRIMDPVEGDCETEVRRLIEECQRSRTELGPAFFFLDQFGYSSVPMSLIKDILNNRTCETFSYLNWNLLLPFMADETKHPGLSRAFGGEEWREVLALDGTEKERRFCELYLAALRTRGGARYAFPFTMRGADDRIIYWIFFCTNKLRGLEEMKLAMLEVDGSGMFQFSDKHSGSLGSLFKYEDKQLAQDLADSLDGRELSVEELYEYAMVNTPASKIYGALGLMEADGTLQVIQTPAGRRKRSFKDYPTMSVRIARKRREVDGSLWSS
jgi:three-Cys-motif partner protein